jgi:hypothetical protein
MRFFRDCTGVSRFLVEYRAGILGIIPGIPVTAHDFP